MKKTIFTGAGVAIVTPMRGDGAIDYERLRELINLQIAEGTDAIVICGTTGESSTMSDEEHVQTIRCAVECVRGRAPVIADAGSNDTAYSVWMSKPAKEAAPDALLQATPYYNKTSQKGLIRHFQTIADATDLPVMLYNVPSRTGMNLLPAALKELSRHPNIVAVKEASGNIVQIAEIAAECGEELDIYSGNDDQIVPILSLGGKGVISVLSNICPKQTHDICRLFFEGNVQESLALQLKYLPLIKALFSDVNPIPVKEALALMGMPCGPCRMPLVEMDTDGRSRLAELMGEVGLLQN